MPRHRPISHGQPGAPAGRSACALEWLQTQDVVQPCRKRPIGLSAAEHHRPEASLGSRKAKAAPSVKHATASPYSTALIRRSRRQDRAASGSVGHGKERPCQSATPLRARSAAATPNTSGLCSLNQMSCGTAVTRLANAAPAPSATSSAGNTQHSNVARLASNAPADRPAVRVSAESTRLTAWPV